MGRPDYDFSFFLTDDFFARKKKTKTKKQKQLEERVTENDKGNHFDMNHLID
jgi:hypothetical protein